MKVLVFVNAWVYLVEEFMHKQYIAMDNGQAIKLHALTFAFDLVEYNATLVEYCQDQEIFSLTRLSI